jgi:hypothetical protein
LPLRATPVLGRSHTALGAQHIEKRGPVVFDGDVDAVDAQMDQRIS